MPLPKVLTKNVSTIAMLVRLFAGRIATASAVGYLRQYTTTTITATTTSSNSSSSLSQSPVIAHSFPASHTGTIQLLFLNDPPTRNSFSVSLITHLHNILQNLPPTTRALILASGSPTLCFCSGANLKERLNFTPEQTASFLTLLRSTLSHLESLSIPTISCINGPALGGGLELALATDFRIVGPRAKLGLPETRLGIIPGAGGTFRLPRLIGQHRAMELILSGRAVDFEEAFAIGLATRKVYKDPDEGSLKYMPELAVVEEVIPDAITDAAFLGGVRLAEEITKGGPVAIGVAKKVVALADEKAEILGYSLVVTTKDRNEGLKAFAEKRQPKFVGK